MDGDLSILDDLPAPDDWRSIELRSPAPPAPEPGSSRRRIVASITAFIVAVAAGTFLVTRFDRSSPLAPAPTPSVGLRELGIALQSHADGWVVLPNAFGVWVAGAGRLYDVDPQTGSVRETGHVESDYDYVRLADYGEGAIWVASGSTLSLVEAGTVSETFDLSSLGTLDGVIRVSADAGRSSPGTWVTASGEGGGVLAEIGESGRVLQDIPIANGAHQLAIADDFIFVLSQGGDGTDLVRVDPDTGVVTEVRGWAGEGRSIAGIGNDLWISDSLGVHCVLAATPAATCGDVSIPRASGLAVDGSRLWVLSDTGSRSSSVYLPDPDHPATLTLVDGTTGSVTAGPLDLPDATPASISAFEGSAWIGFHDSGRIIRIDTCDPAGCRSDSVRIIRRLQRQLALEHDHLVHLQDALASSRKRLTQAKTARDMPQIQRLNARISSLAAAVAESKASKAHLRQELRAAQASTEPIG